MVPDEITQVPQLCVLRQAEPKAALPPSLPNPVNGSISLSTSHLSTYISSTIPVAFLCHYHKVQLALKRLEDVK